MNNIAARFALGTYRAFHFVHRGTQIVFEGICLGLLPESVCDLMTELSYGSGRQYTNDAYLDSGFHFWEALIVNRFFPPGSSVLVAAAGGGREMIALARAGFSVDGFECSRSMVSAGCAAIKARGLPAKLEWAPPSTVPLISETYGGLIVGWNGYTYIAPRARRLAFLGALRAHLSPGSTVLISAAMRSGDFGAARWIAKIANLVRKATFRDVVFEPGASFPGRPRHDFSWVQIESEVEEAGLTLLARYRWGPFFAVVCRW